MTKTLSVSAIKTGTVIDHIPQGQAINIIRMLKLINDRNQMTVGLNLKSEASTLKDLIKIEKRKLSEKEAQEIAVFAPNATINLIDNFTVSKKIKVTLPETVSDMLACPNPGCITHGEPVSSRFTLQKTNDIIKLRCHYCEKTFNREEIQENMS